MVIDTLRKMLWNEDEHVEGLWIEIKQFDFLLNSISSLKIICYAKGSKECSTDDIVKPRNYCVGSQVSLNGLLRILFDLTLCLGIKKRVKQKNIELPPNKVFKSSFKSIFSARLHPKFDPVKHG